MARALFASEQVWIAKTVLLEAAIRSAFRKLLGLGNVQAEDEGAIGAALDLNEHGIEFADAIHLNSRPARGSCSRAGRSARGRRMWMP